MHVCRMVPKCSRTTSRGTGLAAALVGHMVAEARAKGFRIIPLCPYVRAQYARHPDWADVFTTAPGEKPDLPR